MNDNRFLHRQAQALEHVLGYRTEELRAELAPERTSLDHFTIALARDAGAPALEVASEIEQRLGWSVYHRELLQTLARELDVPAAIIEEFDERRQSWLLECLQAFSSRSELSEGRYFRCLLRIIRSLGERGRCVIIGRGAAFILPPQSTLRVRLVGDREDRIAALGRHFGLDHGLAARKAEQINRERALFIRDHFQVDPSKARNYDLVLNSSEWSPADCADFIIEALNHKAAGHRMA
jgi:cytidylate kinase